MTKTYSEDAIEEICFSGSSVTQDTNVDNYTAKLAFHQNSVSRAKMIDDHGDDNGVFLWRHTIRNIV